MSFVYSVGTISVTNGSTAATGTLTAFSQLVRQGDLLIIGNSLAAIGTDPTTETGLTLATPWAGTTVNQTPYVILLFSPRHTWDTEVWDEVRKALESKSNILTGTSAPSAEVGVLNDIHFETPSGSSVVRFRVRGSTAWSAPVNLVGAGVPAPAGPSDALKLLRANAAGDQAEWWAPATFSNVALTGNSTTETVAVGTDSTRIASAALVKATSDQLAASIAALTTAVNARATLASPALTGTPTAPTATLGTNTTQLATMAALKAAIDAVTAAMVQSVAGRTGIVTLTKADVGLSSVDNTPDANKPVSMATLSALNLRAPLASPALTGTPTAPTAPVGTNTTQIATMSALQAAIAGSRVVSGNLTPPQAGSISFNHGLAAAPVEFGAVGVCLIANNGYSVGDIVTLADVWWSANCIVMADVTAVRVVVIPSEGWPITHRTQNTTARVAAPNWAVRMWVRA